MRLSKPAWLHLQGNQPIFSIDIHPDGTRLVTGGQGNELSEGTVVIWNMIPVLSKDDDDTNEVPKALCQLTQHTGCVNCVRWNNSGKLLSSGGDDKTIIIWKLMFKYAGNPTPRFQNNSAFGHPDLEQWKNVATLTRHTGDILDLAWSPSDIYLASASVDNSVIIWDAHNFPQIVTTLTGHNGLVKGVTWDPVGRYLATQSDDKTLKIWKVGEGWELVHSVEAPFMQCSGTTHFLRLDWDPNGLQLVSAHALNNGGPTAQVVERSDNWTAIRDFVGHRKAVVCVRFGRSLMRKGDDALKNNFAYLALGSRDRSVSIWCTARPRPVVVIHDLFQSSVTDISWSSCGTVMVASSLDGTVAVAQFSKQEIGQNLTPEEKTQVFKELYGGMGTGGRDKQLIQNLQVLLTRDKLGMDKETVEDWARSVEKTTAVQEIKKEPGLDQNEMKSEGSGSGVSTPTKSESNNYLKAVSMWRGCLGATASPKTVEITAGGVSSTIKPPDSDAGKENESLSKKREEYTGRLTRRRLAQSRTKSTSTDISKESGSEAEKKKKVDSAVDDDSSQDSTASIVSAQASSKDQDNPPVHRKVESVPLPKPIAQRRLAQVRPSQQPPSAPQQPIPIAASTSDPVPVPSTPTTLLPKMKSEKILNLLVDLARPDASYSLQVSNHHQRSGGLCHQLSCFHSTSSLNALEWTVCTDAPICALAADQFRIVAICDNSTVHILDLKGRYAMPPLMLCGYPSKLVLRGAFLAVVTANALIHVWNIYQKSTVLKAESLETMLTVEDGHSDRHIDIARISFSPEGTPEVVLSTGKTFLWSVALGTWYLISDPRGLVSSVGLNHERFVSGFSRSPSTPPEVAIISSIKLKLAIGIERKKPEQIMQWTMALAKALADHGLEKELRCLLQDLLGPCHSSASFSTSWSPTIIGLVDKRTLLRRVLNLLVEDLRNQELFVEFNEMLMDMENAMNQL